MDGTLAIIFLITSLTDMTFEHCPEGCLKREDAQSYLAVGAHDVRFQGNSISKEVQLTYRMDRNYGPFQPTIAASAAANGATWVGLGATYEKMFGNVVFNTSLLPGYYANGNGPDLGFPIEFRSTVALGYSFGNGMRLSVSYDHRSNSELGKINPGLETYGLQISFPLK